MTRRTLFGGGLAAGLGAMAIAPPAAAAAQNAGEERVVAAIRELRGTLEEGVAVERSMGDAERAPWRAVARIREQQHVFLRASQKYPDFIEVGIQVWDGVYDWLVRTHQPIMVTRIADGRYTMGFAFTTLVLRPEQDANFVGFGFDGERPTRER